MKKNCIRTILGGIDYPFIIIVSFFLIIPFFFFNSETLAQSLPYRGQKVVAFKGEFVPALIRRGEKFRVSIEMNIDEGWHVYSVLPQGEDAPPPTKLTLVDHSFEVEGPVYETRPITEMDKVIGIRLSYHENQAFIYQNFTVPQSLYAGKYDQRVEVYFLACNERLCLPPKVEKLTLSYQVESGDAREAFKVSDRSINPLPEQRAKKSLNKLTSKGFWGFIGLAALMGLVSLITPCVFPMIPITVSFFSKQAEGKQSRAVKLAVIFALGIIMTYTGTGLLFSVLFGASSALQFATHPVVNLAIALLFVAFAFSLMEFFHLGIPAQIQGYFDDKARKVGGTLGVLLMGFTFTLTAFTCTVQFVGTMLIASSQGMWLWPLLGMLVFSTVFAFPFFLLAIAPGLIKTVRRHSGDWLGRAKIVLGIIELMAAVKFFSNADLVWQTNLISRNTAIIIWLILFLIIIIYLIWTNVRPYLNKTLMSWSIIGAFIILTGLTARGLNDHSLGSLIDSVLPPPAGEYLAGGDFVSEEESKKVQWVDSMEEAYAIAKEKNLQVFIDFTGYTCVNCRWMEQNIFRRKEIFEVMTSRFVLVRLYTDGGDKAQENMNYQIERFNTIALPLYVILTKEGKTLKRSSGLTQDPEEFLDFLIR